MCRWPPDRSWQSPRSKLTSSLGKLKYEKDWTKCSNCNNVRHSPSTSKLSSCDASSRIEMTYSNTIWSRYFRFAPGMCFLMNCDKLFFTMSWCCSIFVILYFCQKCCTKSKQKESRIILSQIFLAPENFLWAKIRTESQQQKGKSFLALSIFTLVFPSSEHHPKQEPWKRKSEGNWSWIHY